MITKTDNLSVKDINNKIFLSTKEPILYKTKLKPLNLPAGLTYLNVESQGGFQELLVGFICFQKVRPAGESESAINISFQSNCKKMASVQYIVIRKDIADRLGAGFAAAQISHASLAPITSKLDDFSKPLSEFVDLDMQKWIKGPFIKIVLEVPDEKSLLELAERLDAAEIEYCKINESGLGGELTCIGLKPCNRQEVKAFFKGISLFSNKSRLFAGGREIDLSKVDVSPGHIEKKMQSSVHFRLEIPFLEFVQLMKKLSKPVEDRGQRLNKNMDPNWDKLKDNCEDVNQQLVNDFGMDILESICSYPKLPKTVSFKSIQKPEGFFWEVVPAEVVAQRYDNHPPDLIITSGDRLLYAVNHIIIFGSGERGLPKKYYLSQKRLKSKKR